MRLPKMYLLRLQERLGKASRTIRKEKGYSTTPWLK